MKEITERLQSPVVWLGIVSIIITVSGINPENMTDWTTLFTNIIGIFKNPFVLLSIIVAIFSFLNNPKDKNHF